MHDLIIALYKVKSHKFDDWYEMFTSVKNHQITNTCIYIEVDFDHES